MNTTPSVNALAAPLADSLCADAERLRLKVSGGGDAPRVVDAGIACAGGIEAGRRIAEICLGGLGRVRVAAGGDAWPLALAVTSSQPALACLASQYAGWSLAHGEGKQAWFSLGSGPVRALARKEELFAELGYADRHDRSVLVLETDQPPPQAVVDKVLGDAGLAPGGLTIVLTPTASLAGTTQVVARVLEVALHKAHALGFDPRAVVDGIGCAPLPTPGRDFLTAMARTNDAILYGGAVQLMVDCDDAAAEELCRRLPASCSADYGRSFGELFKAAGHDFYKLDPMLFAPARAVVGNLRSGRSFSAGAVDRERLLGFWLGQA
ncbi:MAG: methenyltetrahydromethanopterin cyclohydrolase [Burkholderiales bacterium]|nr:Methenyltetrahydromethanopterin cyclohydrolase [Rhodocyclaceae bacterium]MCZ2172916.1 methenyltetrahydromethanopterin cyclohydrolase [Burkholderiales bacterium]MCZ2421204.1 methenyltetrahydromethanopterin cyclohydrolase [Burkholderiales bacterium]